ncbi:CRISPR-associated endoribonuclease Cas6 [Clostridium sp. JN-1]|uniref:CRISPR-associated endoribonuclease Cas6 n=1 Tax=Clostridium sp. JN-1 TaxID=2483110 RepID=UPI000F0B51E8|nr:CRISPR-associated endoribonuclease Cas6 [Clostridium sp. JN-1]
MDVIEINVKVYILEDITIEEALEDLSKLIDKSFYKNEDLKNFHEENIMKNYCFNSLYPLDVATKMYKKGCIYNFQLRCIGLKLKNHFLKFLSNEYTSKIKVLVCQSKNILKKPIDRIYSITPIIVKIPGNQKTVYWRNGHTEENFFEYIRTSSIKKYEILTGESIDKSLKLFSYARIDNKKPIAANFKGKKILGDKITLTLETNSDAQNIAYILLGTGTADMCPRGYGFMNYQYIK